MRGRYMAVSVRVAMAEVKHHGQGKLGGKGLLGLYVSSLPSFREVRTGTWGRS